MKTFLTILVLLYSFLTHANTYYVKAGGGTGSGLDDANAWSYAKLNSMTLTSGDIVLFKRGDTFAGPLSVPSSGSSGNVITYGAYGNGEKPIINGFSTLSSWTSIGSNLYEASLNTGRRLNMLTVDGVIIAPGRYPNYNTTTGGYLPVTDATPQTGPFGGEAATITTSSLGGSWVGAEIVNYKNYYTYDRAQITSQSGTTLGFISPSNNPQEVGFGFFIQNSAAALDVANEWYYNSTAQTLRMYGNPAGKVVKAATTEYQVSLSGRSYISFRDLYFTGSDSAVFSLTGGSHHISILNCDMVYNGIEAIRVGKDDNANFVLIDSCYINYSNSFGIHLANSPNSRIAHTTIKNTALIPGLPRPGQEGYGGVWATGDNQILEYNTVDSTGGMGMGFYGNNSIVRYNRINYATTIISDQGGLYTYAPATGRKIIGNIISNNAGAYLGTPSNSPRGGPGLYIDESGSNILVEGNTVFGANGYGVYVHVSHDLTFRNNTLYDNGSGQLVLNDDNEPWATRITNVRLASNTFVGAGADQDMVLYNSFQGGSTMWAFGTADSNYYSRPFNISALFSTVYNSGGVKKFYDVPGWRSKFSRDINGVSKWAFSEYKGATVGGNLFSNGAFNFGTTGAETSAPLSISTEAKLDGTSLRVQGTTDSTNYRRVWLHFGARPAGNTYRIRFSSIGSASTENLLCQFIRSNNFDFFGPSFGGVIGPTRAENEMFIHLNSACSDLQLVLELHNNTPFWIDNVECIQMSGSQTDITDSIRLEYNATTSAVTKSLGGNYVDIKGVSHNGSITLQPYTSAVLRYVSGSGVGNLSPSANAGANITVNLPTSTTTLSGSGTDADGTIASYAWIKLSGSPAGGNISNASIASPSLSSLQAGTYQYQLTVTDNSGATATDVVQVFVNTISNASPTANAGANIDITLPTNSVMLTGSASSDSDGSISSYAWTKISGPAYSINNAAIANPTVSTLTQGTYVFRLTVVDNGGASSTDDVNVNVLPVYVPSGNSIRINGLYRVIGQ